jgi:hypothetical protein
MSSYQTGGKANAPSTFEVLTAVIMKNSIFWDTDISEEHVASIFSVEEQATQETSVKAGGKQCSAWLIL